MNGTAVASKLSSWASASSSTLKKIIAPLARLFTFSLADDHIYPAKTVTISIDRNSLSVVYAKRFLSRIRVKGIRSYACESKYPQPEMVASSLAMAIGDFGVRNAPVTLSIPKSWAVITTAEFPLTVKENLSNVIAYELDRITPFNAANALFDFRVLDEKNGKLTVSVVAVRAEAVLPYINALREKGIAVNRVTVNVSGIETLCRWLGLKKDVIFLEVSADGYECAQFGERGITRVLTGDFRNDDERSRADLIVNAVAGFIETVRTSGGTPRIVILCGEQSRGLREQLKTRLHEPILFLDETDIKLKYPKYDGVLPYAALGSALETLRPGETPLDLLSKGIHVPAKVPKLLTILLLLIILGLWIIYFIAPLRVEERRLAEIDRQILSRKEEVKKIEGLKKEIQLLENELAMLNNFKIKRKMSLDILKELTAIIPKSAWLSRVRVTETTVDLEGYAASATGLLSKLEASPLFKKVEFSSPTFRDTRMNADRFNIKMEIEGVDVAAIKPQQQESEEFEEE